MLPSCLGIKCFLYYIYLSVYISVCFFLIARSLSLDLVLSKTMTKKSYELFSATFPHSLFKCGTTSAAESPHPHLSNKPSLTTITCTMGGMGKTGDVIQKVPFLYKEVMNEPASGLPIQLCLSIWRSPPPPLTLDGAVCLPMKLFNLNA